jgi:tryptophan-rich sensory protein
MEDVPSRRRDAVALLIALAVCFAASAIGGLITATSVDGWYQELARPTWNPPDWVFAPVWTTLFAAMAVAAWLVWRRDRRWTGALTLFAIQLALNVGWSALFFGLRSPGAALIEIVILVAAIAATAVAFWRRSRPAGALMIPYLLWVGFATALTAAIWRLN